MKKLILFLACLGLFMGCESNDFEDIPGLRMVKHTNFTDLGNFVIDLGNIDDPAVFENAIVKKGAYGVIDVWPSEKPGGCTGLVKSNSKGEAIAIHNMDLDLTNKPAYVFTTSYGKYKTHCIYYVGGSYDPYTYDEIKGLESVDIPNDMCVACACPSDVLNEKGLYVSVNMRSATPGIKSTDDGSGRRKISLSFMAQLVAQNNATVKEAVDWMMNNKDYQFVMSTKGPFAFWNLAMQVCDATGEFGIIEIVNGKIIYTSQTAAGQGGHANYYICEEGHQYDHWGTGWGRLALGSDVIKLSETADQMRDAAQTIYYTHCISDVEYAFRDEDGVIYFEDEYRNYSPDWRSEYERNFCVTDDGDILPYNPADELDEKNASLFANCTTEFLCDDKNFEKVQERVLEYIRYKYPDGRPVRLDAVRDFLEGNPDQMRELGNVWCSSFNVGVNCKERSMKCRFWQDNTMVYEFPPFK